MHTMNRLLPPDTDEENDLIYVDRVTVQADPEAILIDCMTARLTRKGAFRQGDPLQVVLTPASGTDWDRFKAVSLADLIPEAERHLVGTGIAVAEPESVPE